jgi:hypothetical protein
MKSAYVIFAVTVLAGCAGTGLSMGQMNQADMAARNRCEWARTVEPYNPQDCVAPPYSCKGCDSLLGTRYPH